MGELFVESDERSSTEEILSVSVANGIYPASESERDTNPGASIANYKIVRVGDIVYNSMRMWQGAVGSSRYNGIVSPAYVVAKPIVELDSTCFGYLLKRPELLYKYLCNSQGNSKDTQTLRYERFAEITAEVPSTIEEQRAISDCLEGLDNLITLHQRMCSIFCFCAFGSRTNFNQSSKDSFGYYATSVPCRRCARCHRRWLQAPLTSPRRLRFRFFLRWRFDRLASARKNSIISLMSCRSGLLSSPLRGSVACVSRVLDSGGGARLPCRISGAVGLRANHEEWRRARKSRRQT